MQLLLIELLRLYVSTIRINFELEIGGFRHLVFNFNAVSLGLRAQRRDGDKAVSLNWEEHSIITTKK
jgi:hypothetical protein